MEKMNGVSRMKYCRIELKLVQGVSGFLENKQTTENQQVLYSIITMLLKTNRLIYFFKNFFLDKIEMIKN